MNETIHVGIGELAASKTAGTLLKTVALGSCVGVVILDPANRTVGLLHVALPDSSINEERARKSPGSFADTGIPALLAEMKKLGWDGRSRLIVKMAGGATILDPNNTFNIGKRNLLAVRKVLLENRLAPISEDVGGTISRSVYADVATGKIRVTSPGREEKAL